MNDLILFFIAVCGVVLGGFLAKRNGCGLVSMQSKKKQENKLKILEFFKEKERVTNNDIEKLLGVSNATAERYLDELEKEGKIEQKGKTGRNVFYTLLK